MDSLEVGKSVGGRNLAEDEILLTGRSSYTNRGEVGRVGPGSEAAVRGVMRHLDLEGRPAEADQEPVRAKSGSRGPRIRGVSRVLKGSEVEGSLVGVGRSDEGKGGVLTDLLLRYFLLVYLI